MKKLIFITAKFPFGSGETFIENEINYLANAFDKIYIFATEANGNETIRRVPDNVYYFPAEPKSVAKRQYIPQLLRPLTVKEICLNCISSQMFAKVSATCYFSACAEASSKRISEFLKLCEATPEDEVVIYSYWLSTIGMCALNIKHRLERYGITANCVSRCHGFDLYADRTAIHYLPFQKHLIKKFDNIYPCSKSGEQHLKEQYPSLKDKISAKYLGVSDHFNFTFPKKDQVFHIVSCSNVIPVKRVHLIPKALSKITDQQIVWTHFGDGEEFEDLKILSTKLLPQNVKADFKGRIPNSQIYDYYNNHTVNLFINVSKSEGLPVSIMEATSFGIPIIATDVGGTNEIMSHGINGFLLSSDFSTEDLASFIVKFCNMDEKEYQSFCEKSRSIFESKFNAANNYLSFCKELIN